MKKSPLLALLAALVAAASMHVIARAQGGPGQNINVVTGSDDQYIGDLFRQRQQEEVIAISSVNPTHMIVAYNDFRTIDFRDDTGVGPQSPVQGLLAKLIDFFRRPWEREREREGVFEAEEAAAANAAWMGFSITDNGGKSWYSGLHPGHYTALPPPSSPPFPNDQAYLLNNFNSASDPVVGATQNEFFFGGIAFNPPVANGGDGKGIGFVSRFTDYNDTETGQNIRFDGTRVLLKSDDFVSSPGTVPKFFVDKPSVAAAPGAPGGKAFVYAAFVVFDQSDPAKLSSKILFFRSTDSGETWSAPLTVSQPLSRNQSPWIVVDPINPANVYIGWRVFANPLYPTLTNAIVGRRSTNGGVSFTPSVPYPVALLLKAFDQPQGNMSPPNPTLPSPRSAAYPTATIDGNGAIHVLVQEYVYPANYATALLRGLPLAPTASPLIGVPRITSTTSYNQGTTWTTRKAIDLGSGAGTQFMPMVTSVGEPGPSCPGRTGMTRSRVIAMYYDARANGVGVNPGTAGIVAGGDKQFDVRVAQASACSTNGLTFSPSEQVSLDTRTSKPPFDVVKIKDYPQYTAVNRGYTMNCAGNCSFAGDYVHQSPRQPYVQTGSGAWKLTTAAMTDAERAKLPAPVVQLVWADTRDGLLPTSGVPRTAPLGLSHIDSLPWQEYVAPGTGFASCVNPGARDQNVYTAEYTPGGLYASAPVTFKAATIPRSYPLYIENRTAQLRSYKVSIDPVANASFDYRTFDDNPTPFARETRIAIAAISSVTGAVVVGPGVNTPISITVEETDSNGAVIVPPTGAKTSVTLNTTGDDDSGTETYVPVINPTVSETKPFALLGVDRSTGKSLFVPKGSAFPNPTPLAPNPLAPNPLAPNPLAPNPLAPNPLAPNPLAPNPLAPNPLAPNPFPGDVTVYDVTDISYVVTNEGEQTAALKVLAETTAANDGKHVFVMLINRAVPTPAFSYNANGDCAAVDNWQAVPISTFVTPLAPNPLAPNPLAPNPLAPNPLAPNPLAPNYPPDVTNSTFYVAPTSPEQTTALLRTPATGAQRLARREGDGRIRLASQTTQSASNQHIAGRPRDVMVVTIRDIVINPAAPALTSNNLSFKVKSEIPNHNGQDFAGEATVTGTAVPDHLAFNPQPSSSTSGATMAPFKVEIRDAFNTLVAAATPQLVTLAIAPGVVCPGGTPSISGNTVTTSGGIATFDHVVINASQTCNTVKLLASAGSIKPATSNQFAVLFNPLTITTLALPNATQGAPYSHQLFATGGTPPLSWAAVDLTGVDFDMPAWLSLNPTTGVLSGTPPAPAGGTTFRVRVTDSQQQAATQDLCIHVDETTDGPLTAGNGVWNPTTLTFQSATAAEIAQTLVGENVAISNVIYTGAPTALGTFRGGFPATGLTSGLILSSGSAPSVAGTNTSDELSDVNLTAGDADLNALIPLVSACIPGSATCDAAVLEFDFTVTDPDATVVKFDYIFASEEYNEFVASPYNDVFGFFLSGPNIPKANFALIPGSNAPVSINNVNGGNPFGFNASNPAYYTNNDPNDHGTQPLLGMIQADGLTKVLTLQATIQPNTSYHMKLAVSDAGDRQLNSWVLIKAQSLTAACPIIVQ